MGLPRGFRAGIAVVLTVAAGIAVALAQEPGQSRDTVRAIHELTSEIRTLRMAVTHSAETQLQGQVLGLYLNLQQARVLQANARLDAVRREIDGAAMRARQLADELAGLEARLPQESDPERRREVELQLRATKQLLDQSSAQEQQTRNREGEIYQAAQTEEARWNELIGRLEQLLKK